MLYKGQHIQKERGKKSRLTIKALVLCASLVLAVGAIGGTLAWLTDNTAPVENTFQPSQVSCAVKEDFEPKTGVKEEVCITNTSDIPAYIRVRLVGYNKDGNDIIGGAAEWLDSVQVNGGNWFEAGAYYYYKLPVEAGKDTEPLIGSHTLADGQVLEILAEAIQSQPSGAVESAWTEVAVSEDGSLAEKGEA